MLLIFSVLYLLQCSTIHAAPLSFIQGETTPSLALSVFSSDQPCACPNQRSLWDILWSCLTTIFACSWVSVHPNMPEPGAPWWKVALRRLALMFWAVLGPEMILIWAMRQWFGARRLARLYRDKKWTKTHGYFIQMGGFMLFKGDQAQGILCPERLGYLYEHGEINFPTVTEEEIHDRSKADSLAKTIVVGQTAWFIAQCLARGIQGLVFTQLEIVTLAFAVLNGLMYFLWWNKPMDVPSSLAVPVYLLDVPNDPPPVISNAVATTPSQNVFNRLKTSLLKAIGLIISLFGQARSAILELVKVKGALWIIYNIVIGVPIHAIFLLYTNFGGMLESRSTSTIEEGQMRVATFYAVRNVGTEFARGGVVVCGTSVLFGAIHCLGWSFVFLSHLEGLAWKISSAIITGIPFILVILNLYFWAWPLTVPHTTSEKTYFAVGAIIMILIFYIGLPAYMFARIFLLVEALTGLRALSPGAHAVVEWSSFIPHI